MPAHLVVLYYIGESIINCVLRYNQITGIYPHYIGRPYLLNNMQVNWIIEWLSETYRQRTLDWVRLHDKLGLEYSTKILVYRLKQRGYFRYIACQKPYLTADQIHARFL
jgi:transposase